MYTCFYNDQEGAPGSYSPSGPPLHSAAVDESHFSRTANDLHSSPYVYPLHNKSVSIM